MIKNLPKVAITLLTMLFNTILKLGVFPKTWKTFLVIISACRRLNDAFLLWINESTILFSKTFRRGVTVHQFGFREKLVTTEQVY